MFFFFFSPFITEPEELSSSLRRVARATAPDPEARDVLQAIGYQLAWAHKPVAIPEQATDALVTASHAMAEELATHTDRLAALEDRWNNAENQADADAIAMEPLYFGLKAMFAAEGIDRVLEQYPDHAGVEAAATELAKAYDAYDEALLDHIGVLCTLADGDALEHLRKSLPEACATVPWWLDGALEAAATKLVEETDSMVEAYAKRLGNS